MMMIKKPKQFFVATACIFNKDNKILLTKRHNPRNLVVHNLWQFPGGSIEYGESPSVAASREIREETGIIIHIQDHHPLVDSHTFNEGAHIVLMIYSADYISGKIDISGDREETSDAKWFSIEEISRLNCMPKIKEQAALLYANRIRE